MLLQRDYRPALDLLVDEMNRSGKVDSARVHKVLRLLRDQSLKVDAGYVDAILAMLIDLGDAELATEFLEHSLAAPSERPLDLGLLAKLIVQFGLGSLRHALDSFLKPTCVFLSSNMKICQVHELFSILPKYSSN
jgi:hypothetical protein